MSYTVSPKELENVLGQSGQERYRYFVEKVADWEQVWSIGDATGWALASDDSGAELVPVWPAEAFARASCQGDWRSNEPKIIELATWLDKWTPGIDRDKRKVAVFPTPNDKGVVVDPQRLAGDLREAMSAYE